MENNSRTRNSVRNAFFSSFTQIVNLLSSYILRFVFVRTLSTEYLGVNGLFTNILTVFSLADLGLGSAIVYSMYKPIAENNKEKIKSYMDFYKKAYRIIALVILTIGLIMLPNLSFFINGKRNIPNINLIFLLYLLDSVFSYLCAYKVSILNATQKNYIYNIYQTIGKIISSILMILALIITKNFILYLSIQVSFKLIVNIGVSLKANKMYPYLTEKNITPITSVERKSIFKSVYGLFCNQIGNVIINGTDNIIISKYISLMAVGLYSNYSMIINALSNFVGQLFNSIIASVGNFGAMKNKEETKKLFDKINFINFIIASFCTVELAACLDTFIELSFGERYLMDIFTVTILIINFYILSMRNVVGTFKYALGIFWEDKYSTLARAIINLVVSIILAKKVGIVGVFIGTVISDLLTTFWYQPYILYKNGFKKSVSKYFIDYIKYALVTLDEVTIIFVIKKYIIFNNLFAELIFEVLCGFVIFATITYLLFKNNEYFVDLFKIIKSKLRKKEAE